MPELRSRRATRAAALAALAFALGTGTALAADATVEMSDFKFVPASVTVSAGDRVTWTNRQSAPHTATSDTGAFDTGTLEQGKSGSKTFDAAGTYPYHCEIHPNMTGTVIVTEGSGGGGGGGGGDPTPPPTDTSAPSRLDGDAQAPLHLLAALLGLALGAGFVGARRFASVRSPRP